MRMKRKTIKIAAAAFMTAAIFLLASVCAFAVTPFEEELESAADFLPDETEKALRKYGFFDDAAAFSGAGLSDIIGFSAEVLKGGFKEPLKGFFTSAAVVIFTCAAGCFLQEGKGSTAFSAASCGFLIMAIIRPILSCFKAAAAFVSAAAKFELALIPAFAAAVTAAGEPRLALSYASFTMVAAEAVQKLSEGVVLPLSAAVLSLGIADGLSPELKLSSAAASLEKLIKTMLGTAAALFSACLGINGVISKSADSLLLKGAKTAAGFVPVVGGALGESLSAVNGGLKLISNAFGGFGAAALFALALPVCAELLLWCAALRAAEFAAGLAGEPALGSVFNSLCSALSVANALVVYCAAVFIASCGIVLGLSAG